MTNTVLCCLLLQVTPFQFALQHGNKTCRRRASLIAALRVGWRCRASACDTGTDGGSLPTHCRDTLSRSGQEELRDATVRRSSKMNNISQACGHIYATFTVEQGSYDVFNALQVVLDCYIEAKPKRGLVQDATYLTFTSPWTKTDELPVSVKAVESWD